METKKKYTKNKEMLNKTTFTHFISVPLIETSIKIKLEDLQNKILSLFPEDEQKHMDPNNPNHFHITISMLRLKNEEHKVKAQEIFKKNHEDIKKLLENSKITLKLGKVSAFTKNGKSQKPYRKLFPKKFESDPSAKKQNVVYLEIVEDENLKKIMQISHLLIKDFIESDIIDTSELKAMKVFYDHGCGLFRAEKFHITLFRVEESVSLSKIAQEFEKFEFGEVKCHSIDISTRFLFDEEKFYMPLFRLTL